MLANKNRLVNVVTKLSNYFYEYLLIFSMAAISVILPLQVFCRFVLNSSLPWPDEIAPYLLAWIAFIGGVVAMRKGEHISFTLLIDKMSGVSRLVVLVFKNIVSIIFLSVIFLFSIPIIITTWSSSIFTLPSVPKGLVYMCVPLGSFAMMILAIANLFREVREYLANTK